MNLIDRDALPVGTLHGWEYVSKAALDAAPVVACEDCKWWGDYGDFKCPILPNCEGDKPQPFFGCWNFKRRAG